MRRLYSEGQLATRYQDELDGGRIWLTHSYGVQTKVRPSVQLQRHSSTIYRNRWTRTLRPNADRAEHRPPRMASPL